MKRPLRRLPRFVLATLIATACVLSASVGVLRAQTADDILRALSGNRNQDSVDTSSEPLRPNIQTYQPAPPNELRAPPSRLEKIFSDRAGRPLVQFGYDSLGVPTSIQVGQVGAAQDSYVLGQDDEIVVVFRGQENATYRQRVNRDGQVILPKLNPITATGRSFGDFRSDLEAQVRQAYNSTNVFVSLGEARQVSVLVSGEVRQPGTRTLSSLASPLDAILLSGGIAKTGSLRGVMLIREGASRVIDLYGVLTQGANARLGTLRDGDRIYVPPLGHSVAIAGAVRREGIYELPAHLSAITASALIKLAGGNEIAGAYQISKMELSRTGSVQLVRATTSSAVRDGEILFVDQRPSNAVGRVTFSGELQSPGTRPRAFAPSVGKVITSNLELTQDSYPMFVFIVHKDRTSNARYLKTFSLEPILTGTGDVPLEDDDNVFVLTSNQARMLAIAASVPDAGAEPPETNTIMPSFGQQQNNPNQLYNPNQNLNSLLNPNSIYNQNPTPNRNPAATNPNAQTPPVLQAPNMSSPGQTLYNNQTADYRAGVLLAPFGTPNSATQQYPQQQQQFPPQQLQPGMTLPNDVSRAPPLPGTTVQPTALDMSTQYTIAKNLADAMGVTEQAVVRVASEHLVWVLDQVRDPGPYLAGDGTSLRSIVQAAGGALRTADLTWVEVTSTDFDSLQGTSKTSRTAYKGRESDFAKVAVHPFDTVRFRRVFADNEGARVAVTGEVMYPGVFDVTRSEKLSQVLERAGGLTDQAYPFGAVFTRRRAAIAEKEGNDRSARSLESAIAALLTAPTGGNPDQRVSNVTYLTTLAQQVRSAPVVGRISAVVDPAVLHAKPELDITLEPGDTVYIPKRPITVTVSGEVLNAGSFQYRGNLSVSDYVKLAGGQTQDSDDSRTFIIYPDGSARPASASWVSFGFSDSVPPGSTIVVPRDLRPFDTMQFTKDIAQILGSLALTAASLHTVL
ncbi:MAG: SLBB domain-containing protein [Proteobacteria bacterium]|nr:SLBB domain-containing protein [Pseudomonadota bacterium]